MSTLLQKLDAHLPFTKTERIIIAIVLVLHALPALEFLHFTTKPPKMDDARVMANLVSPDTAANKSQQPPAPPPPKPKPKEEPKKKTVEEKPSQKPTPQQTQTSTPQQKNESNTQSQMQNAAVAPATTGGASGTSNVIHCFKHIRQTLVNWLSYINPMQMRTTRHSLNGLANKGLWWCA